MKFGNDLSGNVIKGSVNRSDIFLFNKDVDNLINQAEDIMFTEYPLIPLVFQADSYLQKSSVFGFRISIKLTVC